MKYRNNWISLLREQQYSTASFLYEWTRVFCTYCSILFFIFLGAPLHLFLYLDSTLTGESLADCGCRTSTCMFISITVFHSIGGEEVDGFYKFTVEQQQWERVVGGWVDRIRTIHPPTSVHYGLSLCEYRTSSIIALQCLALHHRPAEEVLILMSKNKKNTAIDSLSVEYRSLCK